MATGIKASDSFTVSKLHPVLGAQIIGVDLSQNLDDKTIDQSGVKGLSCWLIKRIHGSRKKGQHNYVHRSHYACKRQNGQYENKHSIHALGDCDQSPSFQPIGKHSPKYI